MSLRLSGVSQDPTAKSSAGGRKIALATEATGTTAAIDTAVTDAETAQAAAETAQAAAETAQAAAETAQAAAETAQAAAETAQAGAETAETNAVAAVAALEHFTAQIDLGAMTEVIAHAGLGGKPVFGLLGTIDATLLYLQGFTWSEDNLTITGGPANATGNVTVHYWIDKR